MPETKRPGSKAKQRQLQRRARILRCVADIPKGRVSTYGSVGAACQTGPRQAAAVLSLDPGASDVPWHRVVGAGGLLRIVNPVGHKEQRERLIAEGLELTDRRVQAFDDVFVDMCDLI
ncbi:MAG: MGMT family protein [Planctomycetota bacterium]